MGVESERKPELGGFTDLALGPCACPPVEDLGPKEDAQHPILGLHPKLPEFT